MTMDSKSKSSDLPHSYGRLSNSKSSDRTNKCSTLCTESQASKADLPHSPKVRPQVTGSTKARALTKEETRTRTRDKGSRSSTVSSMGKKKGMSPKIAQTPRKHKKESRAEWYNFYRIPQQGT
jgi:hypothetical protein